MTKPNILIYDTETQTEIMREMNDKEYAQFLIDKEKFNKEEEKLAEIEAEKEAARNVVNEKLASLGLDINTIETIARLNN